MTSASLIRALALVIIASSVAFGQQTTPKKQAKAAAKAAARAAESPTVKARRDTLKALSADEKSKKVALKAAKSAKDTAKVSQLKQAIAADKAAHKALKAKLPPKPAKASTPAATKPPAAMP